MGCGNTLEHPIKMYLVNIQFFNTTSKTGEEAEKARLIKKNTLSVLEQILERSSLGTAADVLMLIESLTFFRGYLGEDYVQNLSQEEVKVKKKIRFSLCVRNTSSAFHTGLMSEDDDFSRHQKSHWCRGNLRSNLVRHR